MKIIDKKRLIALICLQSIYPPSLMVKYILGIYHRKLWEVNNNKIEVALAGNFMGVTIYCFASIVFMFLFFYNNSL